MPTVPAELKTANALFAHLGVGSAERKFLEHHAFYRYTEVAIPKRRKGERKLLVPERRLKFLQREMLKLLSQLYVPRDPVHGFVVGRGALTNASAHEKRPYLLNIDLKNFFGVIARRRVRGMLLSFHLEEEIAEAICDICTTRNQLPQGAPTSPMLSNMIAYRLDRDLINFSKTHRLRYTRYADDISLFSYTPPMGLFNAGLPNSGRVAEEQLSTGLRSVFSTNGFETAPEKIWYSGPDFRKEVTGLIVNEFPNVKRTFVRNLRSSLYKAETMGISAAEKDYQKRYGTTASLQQVLRGRLEWIAQVRGRSFGAYRTLAKRFNAIFPASPIAVLPTYDEVAEQAIWVIDFCEDVAGKPEPTCAQGTAFFIANIGLVTAHHVLADLPPGYSAVLHRPSLPGKKFKATPTKRQCPYRDLMILEHNVPATDYLSLSAATSPERRNAPIVALGFPSFNAGDELGTRSGLVVGNATRHGVKMLEVSALLLSGISGGPIVNDRAQVVAVAHKGGYEENKQLGVIVSELIALANE
ncbi:reverse transcriptase domain-containing protein [Bradyrhizobium sp. LTSP857]|uniref:reverse transcriptase domain-containing protein n=1 Tax=Bradyrhizobium sp. LTSP857 TaxID=1619231 RepID=UPI0005D2920D|nr:reverse transcriptase domain-containing protein [Bradyrhizobium sp. LTSP857]